MPSRRRRRSRASWVDDQIAVLLLRHEYEKRWEITWLKYMTLFLDLVPNKWTRETRRLFQSWKCISHVLACLDKVTNMTEPCLVTRIWDESFRSRVMLMWLLLNSTSTSKIYNFRVIFFLLNVQTRSDECTLLTTVYRFNKYLLLQTLFQTRKLPRKEGRISLVVKGVMNPHYSETLESFT